MIAPPFSPAGEREEMPFSIEVACAISRDGA